MIDEIKSNILAKEERIREHQRRMRICRQVKAFALPNEIANLLLLGKVKSTNLPENFRLLRCQYDFMRDCLVFVIHHESYEEIDEACHPPMLMLELEMVE